MILVVDDERAVRDFCGIALSQAGYEVDMAADGREALAKLSARTYEAILIDLIMPELDGAAVLAELKARANSTPVVVMTAFNDLVPPGRVTLPKPFGVEQLLAAVQGVTSKPLASAMS